MTIKLNKAIVKIMVVCVTFLLVGQVKAQLPKFDELNINEYLRSGSEDASKLMGNYLSPVFTGLGYNAASSWYNTAKTHKPLGFDLTVTLNVAKAPTSSYSYQFDNADYASGSGQIALANTSETSMKLPTIFGSSNVDQDLRASLTSNVQGQDITVGANFKAPPGIPYGSASKARGYVPMPMIQLGVGLIKNTDLKIRYLPKVTDLEKDGFAVSLIGFGLMHDFKQWIPAIKHIPIDMSVLVAYNRINMKVKMNNNGAESAITGDNQQAEMGINALTYQVLVSKKLAIFTLYGGIGYSTVGTTLKVTGTYEIKDSSYDTTTNPNAKITLTDPINEKFNGSGMRGTAGFRINLAVITLHADYTLQEYSVLSAGLGVSLR